MNSEQNSIAIERENTTWKQNHSSGGSRVIQSEPECLAHDGSCEAPSPPLPRGSATPPKCGPANSEADSGQPTSTRTLHPILGPHELMSCRDEHLAVIQADMLESARQFLRSVSSSTGKQKPVAPFWSLAKCHLEASSGWTRSGRG